MTVKTVILRPYGKLGQLYNARPGVSSVSATEIQAKEFLAGVSRLTDAVPEGKDTKRRPIRASRTVGYKADGSKVAPAGWLVFPADADVSEVSEVVAAWANLVPVFDGPAGQFVFEHVRKAAIKAATPGVAKVRKSVTDTLLELATTGGWTRDASISDALEFTNEAGDRARYELVATGRSLKKAKLTPAKGEPVELGYKTAGKLVTGSAWLVGGEA